jgi:hypothetical protein
LTPPLYREFAQLEEFARLQDESPTLGFRHRLEKHKLSEQILAVVNDLFTQRGLLLKTGTVVDATLIAAPTSTKNKGKARDPEMRSSQKGNQWYFGTKAHIGADAQSGLVHTVDHSTARAEVSRPGTGFEPRENPRFPARVEGSLGKMVVRNELICGETLSCPAGQIESTFSGSTVKYCCDGKPGSDKFCCSKKN